MSRRVVVTGLGFITPIGIGQDAVWESLHAGTSAVRTISRFDPSPFRSHLAAEINDFDPERLLPARQARRTDRCTQLGLAAAEMALTDAQVDVAAYAPGSMGVMMGTALGGIGFAEHENRKFVLGGLREVDPLLALTVFGGALSCNIAIAHGISGVNSTNSMSCASGTIAIGEAFRAIARGDAEMMLAGGSEAPLSPLCFGSFSLIRAMSTRNDDPEHASRPFDTMRDGFVMGEGAAILFLESLTHARARGARIYAEIAGFGLSNDAYHMTQPRPDGREAIRAMRLALQEAGCDRSTVEWVYAHGSSTPWNDATEAEGIRTLFGAFADSLPVSATKGWHAHALGASGAIETAIACLAMTKGWIPPTLNCQHADPAGNLAHVPPGGLFRAPKVVLKNSFGFGGCNAALVLRSSSEAVD